MREFLHDYKQYEHTHPSCIICGYSIDDKNVGRSPDHWKSKKTNSFTLQAEIYFLLCASLVGHPIAWTTQQDGRIVHEIFPIREHESEQLGSGSKENLEWHTEDAFHPLRGDYIALMGIRNPTLTPTVIASNTDIDLSSEEFKHLFKPVFKIRPDDSHLQKNCNDNRKELSDSQKAMQELNHCPAGAPVLFGDRKKPYWRLDPGLIEIPEEKEDEDALNALINAINKNLKEAVLLPGEILFCDNYRVVHGRTAFSANYDGWDRWLERLNLVSDLRKSRAVRKSGTSRILF